MIFVFKTEQPVLFSAGCFVLPVLSLWAAVLKMGIPPVRGIPIQCVTVCFCSVIIFLSLLEHKRRDDTESEKTSVRQLADGSDNLVFHCEFPPLCSVCSLSVTI